MLADRCALEDVAVGVDDRRESGRRRLHHPTAGLDRTQPARRDLLGLHDGTCVARAVGGVQDCPSASLHALASPAGEEHLPRDHHAQPGAIREIHIRRARAGVGVTADLFDRRPQRFEDATKRHVLAERNPAYLHVLVDDVTVGGDHDLRVDTRILGDPDGEGRVEASGFDGDRSGDVGSVEHLDVDRVLGPQHEVEVRVVGNRPGGIEVSFRDLDRWHLERARSLLAPALHGGHLELFAGIGATRRNEAQDHDGNDGQERQRAVRCAVGRRREAAGERWNAGRRACECEPELEDQQGEQDDAAHANHPDERSADL